ncbi:MAG: energy transducer TonB, partial [Candidatus Thiodiazotropha sp.]
MTKFIKNSTDMLGVGLLVATALHAFAILGITFKPTEPSKPEFRDRVKPQIAEAPLATAPPQPQPVDERTLEHPRNPPITVESSNLLIPTEPPPANSPPPLPSARQLLASKNLEIARLTAELERKTQAYAKMPKRKAISASTKEYKYAAYLDA